MSKSIITIVSLVAVVLGSVFAYSFLNKGQEDTKLNLISLNPIDNTASFLWVDNKQDETTFYISGIEMENSESNSNPYFEVIFIIKDVENNSYSSNGFSFFSNIGSFSENTLRVSYNDLGNNDELEVKVKVNTNIVDEGNYFLDLQLNEGSFDLAEINNGVDLRLELEVNEKPHPLQVWLSILLVILLLAICAWFLLLKKAYFPTFSKKGQLNISAPDASIIFLKKNARKLIFGSIIKEKENFLTKLFYGEIQYVLAASSHSAVITPYKDWKTKKILYRLSCKGDTNSEIINSVSYLKHHDKYTLRTDDEKISFEYFNIKHQ
tara:strand:- start:312 stop:1277 length:966 start_codon:yes stop_codon:yes gene_type:complete